MIKFFRKIRYDLMEKNKTGKYLKYAIGEIILVVIGILIALSINNWNEGRQLKEKEKVILTQLKKSLESDALYLGWNIRSYEQSIGSCSWIINTYKNSNIITDAILDTIPNTMPWVVFPEDLAAYKQLESQGIEIISNQNLRNEITLYYENAVKWLKFSIEKYETTYNSINDVWLTTNYHTKGIRNWVPNNRDELKEDRHIVDLVYNRNVFSKVSIELHKETLKDASDIIRRIDSLLK
jgi:Family of unknown function (DUF6090)